MAGITLTRPLIENAVGQVARRYLDVAADIKQLNDFLVQVPNEDMTEMGFSTEDTDTLKSAVGALTALVTAGEAGGSAAGDAAGFAKRVAGVPPVTA